MAHATRYPRADSDAQWFGSRYPSPRFDRIEKVVFHSTEGTSWDPYGGGANAPTLTARPDFASKRLQWRQHFPINQAARALRHPDGTVATNNDHTVQVEIVGTCDRGTHWTYQHLSMWDLPTWAIRDLAQFLRWMHVEWDLPLVAPSRWPAYNARVALPGGVRMAGSAWDAYRGVLGHMHVPGNTHCDPGDLPIRAILTVAKGTDDVSKADVVAGLKTNIAHNRNGETPGELTISVADYLEMGDAKHDELRTMLRAQKHTLDAMAAALVALTANSPIAIKEAFSIGLKALHDELTSIEARIILE